MSNEMSNLKILKYENTIIQIMKSVELQLRETPWFTQMNCVPISRVLRNEPMQTHVVFHITILSQIFIQLSSKLKIVSWKKTINDFSVSIDVKHTLMK